MAFLVCVCVCLRGVSVMLREGLTLLPAALHAGAYFAAQGVRYVSVGGRTVRGQRTPGEKTEKMRTPPQ